MADQAEFQAVFERLQAILRKYEANLVVVHDTADNYYLDTQHSEKWGKSLMFGAAQIKKNYVSFYLFPVYIYPNLLDGISAPLKKRMQGKSCFNFKSVDEALINELDQLTARSVEHIRREKLL
jgi:hypothetical protein